MKGSVIKRCLTALTLCGLLFASACGETGAGGGESSRPADSAETSEASVASHDSSAASETPSAESEPTASVETSVPQQSGSSAAASSAASSRPASSAARTSSVSRSSSQGANTSVRRNLVKGWLGNIDITDKNKVWGWDPENKYITASHSLECSWGNGYGKGYLVDGVKTSNKQMFDQGVWVSCTVNPGWGPNSGTLDDSTVTWRKSDLNEWLIFDLQKVYLVDQVNFSTLYQMSSHGMPQAFTIEVSTDKQNWTVVHRETKYLQDISSPDQAFPFKAVKARYVKLHFTEGSSQAIDNNLAYCAALSEVEIWGKDA